MPKGTLTVRRLRGKIAELGPSVTLAELARRTCRPKGEVARFLEAHRADIPEIDRVTDIPVRTKPASAMAPVRVMAPEVLPGRPWSTANLRLAMPPIPESVVEGIYADYLTRRSREYSDPMQMVLDEYAAASGLRGANAQLKEDLAAERAEFDRTRLALAEREARIESVTEEAVQAESRAMVSAKHTEELARRLRDSSNQLAVEQREKFSAECDRDLAREEAKRLRRDLNALEATEVARRAARLEADLVMQKVQTLTVTLERDQLQQVVNHVVPWAKDLLAYARRLEAEQDRIRTLEGLAIHLGEVVVRNWTSLQEQSLRTAHEAARAELDSERKTAEEAQLAAKAELEAYREKSRQVDQEIAHLRRNVESLSAELDRYMAVGSASGHSATGPG